MKRWLALVAFLVALVITGTRASTWCEIEACCCEDDLAQVGPSVKRAMTCCPEGSCIVVHAGPIGTVHDAIGHAPMPSAAAVAAAPPMPEPARVSTYDEAAIGPANSARGPPVAAWLKHRALLL